MRYFRAVAEEKYVVALPEGHRLPSRAKVRVADLRDEDLIAHTGGGRSAMYDAVAALCRDAGSEPAIRHEVAETSTLVTFVAGTPRVAIVPEPVAQLVVAGTVYRPLASRAVYAGQGPCIDRSRQPVSIAQCTRGGIGGLLVRDLKATGASTSEIGEGPS
ncbi:MAG: LysR family substrate-binding domain-containing protein [Nocardioides sp.]|uniref:LysR family substrate-binding domain-containing protein n=1 Tax=Nocardioides sp. TaxID=35761 RepID=UPI003267DC52